MRGDQGEPSASGAAHRPREAEARIRVELSERETRAIVRATTLVADVLRPELLRDGGASCDSPLVTAYQKLIAACERGGVDLGLLPTRDRGRR